MIRLLSILLPMLLAESVIGSDTTTLAKMLSAVQLDAVVSEDIVPLEVDWIGDIRDANGKVTRLRLEKGRITKGQISLLRTDPYGRYRGSDAPVYRKTIPTSEHIRKGKTVKELETLLGAGHPGFSGWGGPEVFHSNVGWICIGPSGEDGLAYLSVFAQTSGTEEQYAKNVEQAIVVAIRRGLLRPANPDKKEEAKLYLSGADMFAAKEKEKAIARQRYPRPLRDLIEADEHPDDSNLEHLAAAIQAIRNDPDPKLFRQLVQGIHEGTMKIRSLLKNILLNEHHLPGLKPWDNEREAIAVSACIEALPLAKESGSEGKLVEIVLKVCGGGKIEIEGKRGGRSIEVIPSGKGYTVTLRGVKEPLSLEAAQGELRRIYAKSIAEQGGADQPTTAPESKSEGKEKPKPKSEGRSQ